MARRHATHVVVTLVAVAACLAKEHPEPGDTTVTTLFRCVRLNLPWCTVAVNRQRRESRGRSPRLLQEPELRHGTLIIEQV